MIANGSLQIGQTVNRNVIPASGEWTNDIKLTVHFCSGETCVIRGESICIELHGEGSFVEEYLGDSDAAET